MRGEFESRRPTLIVALLLACAAAAFANTDSDAELKIVASTSDLAALAIEIGGDRAHVESIVRGNQDPHSCKRSLVTC